jgi:hypothetical protein
MPVIALDGGVGAVIAPTGGIVGVVPEGELIRVDAIAAGHPPDNALVDLVGVIAFSG